MSKDAYAEALKNALNEVKNICPDISLSFIFKKDGTTVAKDLETTEETIEKIMSSFQSIVGKEDTIGGLQTLIIEGEEGKVHISYINDLYLALATSKNADANFLQAITRVIFPTVLKLLDSVTPIPTHTPTPAPIPLQSIPIQSTPSTPSEQLIVDTLSGFFVGDSVQVDLELLKEWSELLNRKSIDEVEIETFSGKETQCKVKELSDPKLQGKRIIRIPEKICKVLEVKKGQMVRVKPLET
ncbi:MAG: roadblock/LC7 domain-containing protein [Candidatus Bathyarchaeaceae archaeon]